MKSSKIQLIKPTIVLMLISLIVTVVLAYTYSVTSPVISELKEDTANSARAVVFKGSDTFEKIDHPVSDLPEGIVDIYQAENGEGVVITSVDSGFEGDITVMTGINKNGKITGITVLDHSETPGLGTKAMTEEYLSQYTDAGKIVLKKDSTGTQEVTAIDAVTGATISSEAIYRAVEKSLSTYKKLGGDQ